MATTLKCAQCGHENESERIYCHNCGVKLDRSLLPVEEKKEAETGARAQKRVRKLTNPPKIHIGRLIKSFIATFAWAALVASLIQMSRAPDGAPDAGKENELVDAPAIDGDLQQAAESASPVRFIYSEEQVNGYLRNRIRPKAGEGALGGTITFGRAFADFRQGAVTMSMSQKIFDYPIYASAIYEVKVGTGEIEAVNYGGAIGRMPIHPAAMRYLDAMFTTVWTALKPDRESVARLQSIAFHDNQVVMISKPAGAQ